jgi:hypothetical protein
MNNSYRSYERAGLESQRIVYRGSEEEDEVSKVNATPKIKFSDAFILIVFLCITHTHER